MEDAALLCRITQIFRDVLRDPAIELTPATNPDDLPAWDSLAQISLAVETECRFAVEFEASEVEQWHDVAGLIRLIRTKSAALA